MESLRKICFNRKAQALIEVAVFGAILLTVLSFLIRYGMIYNQRQSLNMRAFRKALSESVSSERPGNEATIYLVEDKHIPDAGDMFGVGDVYTAEAGASVVWGNTLKTEEYEDRSDLPKIRYIINEQEYDEEREYTTAGYYPTATYYVDPEVPQCLSFAGNFLVRVADHDPIEVEMSDLRSINYGHDEDNPTRIGVVVLVGDKKKDIVSGVWNPGSKAFMDILYAEAAVDDPRYVGCFALLDSSGGQINPDYMVLNNDIDGDGGEDVDADNIQGLFTPKQVVTRGDSLELQDSSTDINSTTKNNTTITVTHTIKRGGFEDSLLDYIYSDEEEESWIVQK